LDLYTINNEYIDYLKQFDKRVYDNKAFTENKGRKYVGIIFQDDERVPLFIPLSSKKTSDYINGKIRRDTLTIIRLNNGNHLYGTLRISNMIPVPNFEIEKYDIDNEEDQKYKDLLLNELKAINRKKEQIRKSANTVYKQKNKGLDKSYLKNTVDFQLLIVKYYEYMTMKFNEYYEKNKKA